MMTIEQKYILSAIRAALHGSKEEQVSLTQEQEESIAKMVLKSGILLTVYKCLSPSLQVRLRNSFLSAQKQAIIQNYDGERILRSLSDAGYDCIALKGWELRRLYPGQLMRQMADIDILARPYVYPHIREVMERLGFVPEDESSWMHDGFRKGELHVEMHKRLTDDSGTIQRWERDMWGRALPVASGIYKMSSEDYYVYHFVHLHRDFMNGSLGLRRIVDTWLLQQQGIDMYAVKEDLQRFGIWMFHERMVTLSHVVMGDEPMDDNSSILLAHAFTHGIYGSDVSYKAGRIVAMGKNLQNGKLRSAVAAVFLPYKRMKAQFPLLRKWPILLPWCWIRRIAFLVREDMKKNCAKLDYRKINEKDFEEMKSFFKAGGVR